ncbi:MAG: aldolase/citrate lyase family protein [Candidatus Omnitrophica bacterium]|nr:aldolase/citrate lyase family protein [Candidatus Omnitrophota bacterium]
MIRSRVLEKLRMNRPVICPQVVFKDPSIIEVVGLVGFDCVWLCNEHFAYNMETLFDMVRATRTIGIDAIVRIDKAGYTSAMKPLEMGAKGIVVPHILSVDEARFWIRVTRFYPEGRRGINCVNADADWGLINNKEYLSLSNKETFLILQIEDPEVLPFMEDIAQLDNFDILFLGTGDLAHSMGLTPGEEHEEIWDVIKRLAKICNRYGKIAGAPGYNYDYTKKLLDLGYRFITNGADLILLRNAFSEIKKDYEKIGF